MPDFYDGGHAAHGPLVVLIHGAGSNHTNWRYQTRFLANRGYRVMAIDLPSHGANPDDPLFNVEDMAAWLVERMPGPGAVVGHSLGGLIALELLRTHPELVTKLGLLGCSIPMRVHPELQQRAHEQDPRAIQMILGWSYSGRLGGHPEPGTSPSAVTARVLEAESANLGPDLAAVSSYEIGEEALRGIDVPTLLIAGEKDRMVSTAASEALATSIRQSLIIIPNGGHFMITDSPDEVRKALSPFLAAT